MILISKLNYLPTTIKTMPRLILTRYFTIFNKPQNINPSLKRTKSLFPKFKVNEQYFKEKDSIPDGYNLIYRSTLNNYLLGAQAVSVLSVATVGLYVVYADSAIQHYEPHISSWKEQPLPVDNEILVYLSALLTVSVLMQYIIKKMPIRIYNFRDENFLFVYYNVFPGFTKKASCGLKEIRKLKPKMNPILPWTNSRYEVHRNYGTIIVDNFFKDPAELNIMLGIQKRFVEE